MRRAQFNGECLSLGSDMPKSDADEAAAGSTVSTTAAAAGGDEAAAGGDVCQRCGKNEQERHGNPPGFKAVLWT